MEDKLKSTFCLTWERMWRNEKWVWILFIIAIIIILAYHLLTAAYILNLVATCIQSLVEMGVFILSKSKELLYTLAISYVSGIVVYYLTVLRPEIRKSKPILMEIEQSLKYLIDDIYREFDFINLDNAVDIAMRYIRCCKKQEDYNLHGVNPILKTIHQSLETTTAHVLSFPSAFSQSELETLVDIRHRRITRRIKSKYRENESLTQYQVETDVREFIKLNKDIIALHKQIRNRIYKQNNNK